jgi:hypothetical protein
MLKQKRHAGHQTAGVRGVSGLLGSFFEPAFGGCCRSVRRFDLGQGIVRVSDVVLALKANGYGGLASD